MSALGIYESYHERMVIGQGGAALTVIRDGLNGEITLMHFIGDSLMRGVALSDDHAEKLVEMLRDALETRGEQP